MVDDSGTRHAGSPLAVMVLAQMYWPDAGAHITEVIHFLSMPRLSHGSARARAME